jgi:hypothetical protein
MSGVEIEQAIRRLPQSEARALLQRVEDLRLPVQKLGSISDEIIAKWQVKDGFAAGLTTNEYIWMVRDGDRD